MQILHQLSDAWISTIYKEITINFTIAISQSLKYWLYRAVHFYCSVQNLIHCYHSKLFQSLLVHKDGVHCMFDKFFEISDVIHYWHIWVIMSNILGQWKSLYERNLCENIEKEKNTTHKCTDNSFIISEISKDIYAFNTQSIKSESSEI